MASNKPKTEKAKAKEEKKINKLEIAKEVLKKEKVKEAEKQKGIYALLGSFQIVRN